MTSNPSTTNETTHEVRKKNEMKFDPKMKVLQKVLLHLFDLILFT